MKKLVIVVRNGCVESVFTDIEESIELEIVDFDPTVDSSGELEALEVYVDDIRTTMKEL